MKAKLLINCAIWHVTALMLFVSVIQSFAQTAVIPVLGDGSATNPYQIENLDNLYWIASDEDNWDKHYIQTVDINAYETKDWFSGTGWSPIWTFSGSYNGKGYIIDSLYINGTLPLPYGLFGQTNSAVIDSLGISNVNFKSSGEYPIGALTGIADNSSITNCFSSGIVDGVTFVGGLIGHLRNSNISNCNSNIIINAYNRGGGLLGGTYYGNISDCYSQSYISGKNNFAFNFGGLIGVYEDSYMYNSRSITEINGTFNLGGLIGFSQSEMVSKIINCSSEGEVNQTNGEVPGADSNIGGLIGVEFGGTPDTIINCFSHANITGNGCYDVGGLIGYCINTIVIASFSTGNVIGNSSVGGFIGLSNGRIENSYTTSNISGENMIGGFVGENIGSIINCYSTGRVNGVSNVGGFCGVYYDGSVLNSFWDTEISGQSTSPIGTGKTTSEMKDYSIYRDAGWDFMDEDVNGTDDEWGINHAVNSGYPFLLWQGYENNPTNELREDLQISDVKFNNDESDCFNATNTITVAGDETEVIFETGSSGTLIAGNSIRFLPGFHAQSGSYVSAYITETSSFCDALPEQAIVEYALPETYKSENLEDEQGKDIAGEELLMSIYPNPSNGLVTLEVKNLKGLATVSIYTHTGAMVHEIRQWNGFSEILNLEHLRKGLFLVVVESNNAITAGKLMIE